MAQVFLTRNDLGVGEGAFDSIAWLFETHLREADIPEMQSAVLHGNEDSPDRIELFYAAEPLWNAAPDKVWVGA
jgi:hypothetical protein